MSLRSPLARPNTIRPLSRYSTSSNSSSLRCAYVPRPSSSSPTTIHSIHSSPRHEQRLKKLRELIKDLEARATAADNAEKLHAQLERFEQEQGIRLLTDNLKDCNNPLLEALYAVFQGVLPESGNIQIIYTVSLHGNF